MIHCSKPVTSANAPKDNGRTANAASIRRRSHVALPAARGLHDHTDELAQITQMPLEERAAALAAIHEDLASVLHKAEG